MNEHLSQIELESYILGALSAERASIVEEHVATCDSCAAAMTREARLEMALEVLASDLEPVVVAIPVSSRPSVRTASRGRRAAPVVAGLFGALAVAASVVLWLGTSHVPPAATAGQIEIATDAAGSLAVMPVGSMASDSLDGG